MIFIFVFICLSFVRSEIYIPNSNVIQDQIIESAVIISQNNFNFLKPTVVLSEDVEENIVGRYLRSYDGTVTVEVKDGAVTGQVVVLVPSYKSFKKLLAHLKPDLTGKTLLRSSAKFLILLLHNPIKMEVVTKILWSYHVTDVIIVSRRNDKVAIFTYFPYENPFNCQNYQPRLIGIWGENTSRNIYSDKMANMNGCPLYISTNKLYHMATEYNNPLQTIKKTMIRLLRDVMNCTPIISTREYVSIDSDLAKNWSYSLNDVIMGLANISTCSIPLGIDRLGLLDYTIPYFRVRLVWFAPPITPGPVWWRLLSPLNGYLWLIILPILLFVTSLPYCLKLRTVRRFCYRYFKNIDKVQSVVIRVWGVLLGQPIRVAPLKFRDFYIISLWMWFTFVVRSAYQSVLIGALKTDTLIGNFLDLQEIIDNGYEFGGRAGMVAHFEHEPSIKDSFEVIPEDKFEETFHDVTDGRRNFVVATSLEYALAYCTALGKKENECGHMLPNSILTAPLVVWMKMHSPFKRTLAVWVPRFIETGLLDKDAIKKTTCCVSKITDPTPLTRHQTLSCFLCLFIGYLISIAIFLIEIVKVKSRKKQENLEKILC